MAFAVYGKVLEEDGVGEREDGGVGADAQGERDDGHGGEARVLGQSAKSES